MVLGMGFTFDDSGEADDDTPGIPSPIATIGRLIAANPQNTEVIFPYITVRKKRQVSPPIPITAM